jgi:predicted membrane protein
MTSGDYFFLIFLGVITGTRLLLVKEMAAPTIKGFRLRHHMYGLVLIPLAFLISNITIYAVGFALLVDELPLIVTRGFGHKNEHWDYKGYHSPYSVTGVLVLIFLTYIFRDIISAFI